MSTHFDNSSSSSSGSGGIGFCGLLTIVFVTLKLLSKISWPWFWVLSPVWIPFSLVAVVLVAAIAIALIAA